ncbi:MAG: crossover junction endodeoxyribonuclease RuvC [Pseudomonadota bacterium]
MKKVIRVLGIDPGLTCTGWGVLEMGGGRLRFVASGAVRPNAKNAMAQRLAELLQTLRDIVDDVRPDEAAVERTFVNANPASALKLGQARAAALIAPAEAGLEVAEYAPNEIKKSVVGVGHADKRQVQDMVARLLPGARAETADAADALAIAICHAHWRGSAGARARLEAAG